MMNVILFALILQLPAIGFKFNPASPIQRSSCPPFRGGTSGCLQLSPTCIPGCLLRSGLQELGAGRLLSAVLLRWQRHQRNVWELLPPLWTVLLDQHPGDSTEWPRSSLNIWMNKPSRNLWHTAETHTHTSLKHTLSECFPSFLAGFRWSVVSLCNCGAILWKIYCAVKVWLTCSAELSRQVSLLIT